MKKVSTLITAVLIGFLLIFAAPLSAQSNDANAPFVIVFDEDNLPADVGKLVADAGGELLFWFPEVGIAAARAGDANFAAAMNINLSVSAVGPAGRWSSPQTVYSEPLLDEPTATDDLYFALQWDIRRVGADQAWAAGSSGSHNTVVSVIDQGVDNTHPDLAPNVVFQDCMQLGGPCPPNMLTGDHGTHVAGTVAAAFDGGRVVGVGPNLGLAGYQVFENSGGAWDPVIFWAMLDTAARGFQVINMSLGGYYQFPQTQGDGAAVWTAWNRVARYTTQMGVTIVASAGNGAVNVNGPLYHIPGDIPQIINVSATGIQPDAVFPQDDFFDILAFYSNTGAAVDIAAPGGDCGQIDTCDGNRPPNWFEYLVLSTVPGGYGWKGGTSMASPHVAGAAGLVMDENPGLNPHQVAAVLKRTADKIGPRQSFGSGMLNVDKAVGVASK